MYYEIERILYVYNILQENVCDRYIRNINILIYDIHVYCICSNSYNQRLMTGRYLYRTTKKGSNIKYYGEKRFFFLTD